MFEDLMLRVPDAIALRAGIAEWTALLWEDIVSMPRRSAALAFLALLTGVLSRRFTLLLGSLLLSLIAISALVTKSPDLAYLSMTCQILMILSAIGYRRHARRLTSKTESLRAEKDRLQDLLDREVRWRMASDSVTAREGDGENDGNARS